MSDKIIHPRERDLYRERDELRAEIKQLREFVQKVALYCNDSWLAREADKLAPGATLVSDKK
jgi:hypothetical protein